MDEQRTPVDHAQSWLAAHARPQPDVFLESLRTAALEAGLPSIDVAPEEGAALQLLVRAVGATRVVEVGTLGGYSAVWMARGMPADGVLQTIEFDPHHAAFARDWTSRPEARNGGGRIEVLEGAGAAVLPTLPDGAFDLMFIDADKAGYDSYLDHAFRLLRPGGVFLADNALAFGQLLDDKPTDAGVAHLRKFHERMAGDAKLAGSVVIPLGDGFWFAVKP